MKKRILSALLAILMVFSMVALSACKNDKMVGGKPKPGALTTKSLKNIYSAKELEVKGTALEGIELYRVQRLSGNKLLITGQDNKNYEEKHIITDADLSFVKELPLNKPDNENSHTYIQSIAADKQTGEIWYLKNVYTYVQQPVDDNMSIKPRAKEIVVSEVGSVIAENDAAVVIDYVEPEDGGFYSESRDENFIVRVSADGEIISETNIDSISKYTDDEGNEQQVYINTFVLTPDSIIFSCGNSLAVADKETLEVKNRIESENYFDNLFATATGELFYTVWGENGMEAARVDPATGKTEKAELGLGERIYNYSFVAGELGYDLCLADNTAFYGFNIGDSEPTEICNYVNSDIATGYGQVIPAVLDDGRLVITLRDYNTGTNQILVLTKVAPEDVKEKYVITVAGEYIAGDIKNELIKFNRTNDTYKVVFKEYQQYNTEENEWRGAQKKLAEDISSRENAPDIVMISDYGETDVEGLAAKGVFIDLENFMQSDESFNRADYLENVLDAMQINGKTYMVAPTVSFVTLVGKKDFFGGKESWTMKDFLEMHQGLAEGESMISEPSRENIGRTLIMLAKDEFIGDDGKCSFNSEQFKDVLRYLKDIPADYTAYEDLWQEDQSYWENQELSYSKGTTKLRETYLYNFNQVPESEGYFGGEIEFVGYPTSDTESNGVIIRANTQLAVSSASKVPAGAWEVIKYLLSDKYQELYSGVDADGKKHGNTYLFPLKKSVIEQRLENDLVPMTYTDWDEDGNEIEKEAEPSIWLGNGEVKLRKSTPEDAQRIYDIVSSANVLYRTSTDVEDIILQEAAGFFDGQKSVDEVADIINSRVQLLVNERR